MAETPKTGNVTRRHSSAPTSAAVAERAGVSRTTVSFVLNDVRSMNISEATRQKVFDAARELGYEPNAAARSLAGGSTGTVAVLIPRSDHLHVDAFLPRLLSAVNDRCHSYGYKVLIEAADDQGKLPGAFMNLVRGKRVDGLVIANPRASERRFVDQLVEEGFPVAVPGNSLDVFHSRGGEVSDLPQAREITEHLIGLGHKRIAHIAFAPEEFEVVGMRRRGYEEALLAAGLTPDPALLSYADVSAQSGYEAMKAMLKRKLDFTAVFAGNDTVAFGVLRALFEAGLRVPADVALVGFDDIPLAAFFCPSLTTVRTDPVLRGHEAVDLLHGQMTGVPFKRLDAPYPTRFIVRESCGAKAGVQPAGVARAAKPAAAAKVAATAPQKPVARKKPAKARG
jgi:DNA-binding LacI/PurR family transcriptional regulator